MQWVLAVLLFDEYWAIEGVHPKWGFIESSSCNLRAGQLEVTVTELPSTWRPASEDTSVPRAILLSPCGNH